MSAAEIKCKFCEGTGRDEENAALSCSRCRGEGIVFCDGCLSDSGDSEAAVRCLKIEGDEIFTCARHAEKYDAFAAWESRGDYERDLAKDRGL